MATGITVLAGYTGDSQIVQSLSKTTQEFLAKRTPCQNIIEKKGKKKMRYEIISKTVWVFLRNLE